MNFYLNFEWNQVIGTTRDQKLLTGNIMRNQNNSYYTAFEDFQIYSYYQGSKLSNWNSWSDAKPNHHNHLFLIVKTDPITGNKKAITFDYWASIAFPLLYDTDKLKNHSAKKKFEALSIARIEAFKHFVDEGYDAYNYFTFEEWSNSYGGKNTVEDKKIFDACWKEYELMYKFLGRSHKKVETLYNDLYEWEQQKDRSIWHLDRKPIVREYP